LEAEKVHRYNARVPRDLEAVVHKCLEKDADRRDAAAAGLAAELDRGLRGEPVRAPPPALSYLLEKWARGRRAAVRTAAAVLLAALAGAVVAFVQIDSARRLAQEKVQTAERLGRSVEELEAKRDELHGQMNQASSVLARTYSDVSDLEFRQ